ncbi:MAG TPA: hypothetical protein VFR24_27550 [Candidatus Angelobacter sp.]|nr:hypothetical protein [Candidatus Angelobacter sp.]
MADDRKLQQCPFCGSNEIEGGGKYLSPTMQGPGALISWEIWHHCKRRDGVIGAFIRITGRDKESAEKQWNKRFTKEKVGHS